MTRVLGPKPKGKADAGLLDRVGHQILAASAQAREKVEGWLADNAASGGALEDGSPGSSPQSSPDNKGLMTRVLGPKPNEDAGLMTRVLGPKPTPEAGVMTRMLGPEHMFKPADPTLDIHGRPLAGPQREGLGDPLPTDPTNRAARAAGLPFQSQAPPTDPQLQHMSQPAHSSGGGYERPPTDPRFMQGPNSQLSGAPPYAAQEHDPQMTARSNIPLPHGERSRDEPFSAMQSQAAPPTDPQLLRAQYGMLPSPSDMHRPPSNATVVPSTRLPAGSAPPTDPQLQAWGSQMPAQSGGYGGYRPS